ncbi:hypothetical protein ACH4VX_34940 [Streptomyces sp. NPDC020731]|uniref:hypothetical protein n=1 Tax=Streptomyces sp. NPDC020731 TaxID=3365085 RepID=UPI0037B109C9
MRSRLHRPGPLPRTAVAVRLTAVALVAVLAPAAAALPSSIPVGGVEGPLVNNLTLSAPK